MSEQSMERTVGNYRIGSLLGKGGMGDVFVGEHIALGRGVAVKFMAPSLAGDEEFVRRFMREARVMARLDHPNIVRVLDCGQGEGEPYLVMELLDGETLRERLRRGELAREEAVRIAKSILAALGAAHSQGVVHRDIKPGNIFLCRDGTVKVMDFGIAKAASESHLTQTGTQLGTAEYMSPEQAEGATVDGRSDLYSAGIVLYQMLAGGVPFTGDNSLAVLHQHVHKAPPPLPNTVPPILRRVIQKALAKSPNGRYQTASEMEMELEKAAAEPIPTPTPAPQPIVQKPKSDAPGAIAVAAVVLIVGYGAWSARHREQGRMTPNLSKLSSAGDLGLGQPTNQFSKFGGTRGLFSSGGPGGNGVSGPQQPASGGSSTTSTDLGSSGKSSISDPYNYYGGGSVRSGTRLSATDIKWIASPVTRREMAKHVALRLGGSLGWSSDTSQALDRMSAEGIVFGDPSGNIQPDKVVTEGEAVMILNGVRNRLVERRILKNSGELINLDLTKALPDTHWASTAERSLKTWHILPNDQAISPDAEMEPSRLNRWLTSFEEVVRKQ